jgi:hypothetical protein
MSLGLSLGLSLRSSSLAYSPLSLFAAGEQGYWLDPSDFGTMFQDDAGTTPVTAVGQSVGRWLDKSGLGNHFIQPNVANRPILQVDSGGRHFLLFDGSDDFLQSAANINPGAVDKVEVFAGVRKLSDAASGLLVEASSNGITNDGTFSLQSPEGSAQNYSFRARGIGSSTGWFAVTFTAPITSVLSCSFDNAGSNRSNVVFPRVNGATPSLSPAGGAFTAGNFLTYQHFIGRRNGISLPFNGRLYQLITRYGPNLSADQIAAAEVFVNQKTGAF